MCFYLDKISIGNLENLLKTFKSSHKCSHTMERIINPFILQTLIFHPLGIFLRVNSFYEYSNLVEKLIYWLGGKP